MFIMYQMGYVQNDIEISGSKTSEKRKKKKEKKLLRRVYSYLNYHFIFPIYVHIHIFLLSKLVCKFL